MKKGYIKNIIAAVIMTCSLFTFLACGNTTTAYAEQIPNESGYVFGNVNITGGGYIPDVIFNKSEKDLAYLLLIWGALIGGIQKIRNGYL